MLFVKTGQSLFLFFVIFVNCQAISSFKFYEMKQSNGMMFVKIENMNHDVHNTIYHFDLKLFKEMLSMVKESVSKINDICGKIKFTVT